MGRRLVGTALRPNSPLIGEKTGNFASLAGPNSVGSMLQAHHSGALPVLKRRFQAEIEQGIITDLSGREQEGIRELLFPDVRYHRYESN